MSKTSYEIKGQDIYINGKITYSELKSCPKNMHGLLFNARFIQGIFDNKNPKTQDTYNRFGRNFDPETNTDEMINSLQEWYDAGLRAITLGLQGGGPCFTEEWWASVETKSFSKDGKTFDPAWKKRLEKVLKACDEMGMLVIVSILYQAQANYFDDGVAIVEAVKTASKLLSELNYTNVIIEVANEMEVGNFSKIPTVSNPDCMAHLIDLAKEYSNNKFAVGCSGGGGVAYKSVVEHSDIVLVHGNGLSRESYYKFLVRAREMAPDKPIVCNEDSQMFPMLDLCRQTHTSWGYYNNMTKQEPPVSWGITRGEDEYFAKRLTMLLNGQNDIIPTNNPDDYYLQGFEENTNMGERRFIKVTTLFPEQINYVEYYEDDKQLYISYDMPHLMYMIWTWQQNAYIPSKNAKTFTAKIYLTSGTVIEKKVDLTKLNK